jgi:two-component system response regulator YesN
MKVLIVDDEPLALLKIRSFQLDEYGFEIIGEAENGLQALEFAKREKPDIVLTDIGMPVMDGLQLVNELAQLPSNPKVILLTCYEDFEKVQTALRYGVQDYVTKLLLKKDDLIHILEKAANNLSKERIEEERNLRLYLQEQLLDQPENFIRSGLRELRIKPNQYSLATIKVGVTTQAKLIALQRSLECSNGLYHSIVCWMSPQICCLVFLSYEDHTTEAFGSWCLEQCSYILNILKGNQEEWDFIATLGGVHSPFIELSKAYLAVIEQSEICFYHEKGELLKAGEIKSVFVVFPAEKLQGFLDRIVRALQGTDVKEASKIIGEWMEAIEASLPIRPVQLKQMAKAIAGLCTNSVNSAMNEHVTELLPNILISIDNALHYSDVARIIAQLRECLNKAISLYSSSRRKEINDAISYIHTHYQEVQLADAASFVNLSPSWFASLFRSEVGQSFHEYIQIYRLEISKRYLLTSDLKVYEIALEIGIPNARYFSRLFTEYVGITPLEFRKAAQTVSFTS